MSAGEIGFLVFVWLFVGWGFFMFSADSKPIRTSTGIAIAWPVIAAIYAARAVYDALVDALRRTA